MLELDQIVSRAVNAGASDIHLKTSRQPIARVAGRLVALDDDLLSHDQMRNLVQTMLPPHLASRFDDGQELDFSKVFPGAGRFRVNVFLSSGGYTVAMRHVLDNIRKFEELNLPDVIRTITLAPRGIVLVCGTTGSGKSTTLAACIDFINHREARRIITVEDPIEYLFHDHLSVISQREIGLDTETFHLALKFVMRQDPDVIMIGEMRDQESFGAALAASETGHLVFTTLHAADAPQTITRILDMYPRDEHTQILRSLSINLRAVVCQRLVPGIEDERVPATEVLVSNSTVRKLLQQGEIEKIGAAVETGVEDGMHNFNQSIYKLIKAGKITEEDGLAACTNPEALRMNLRGIFLDESRRILS